MNDDWDDILIKIEKDHGRHKAQQVSDLIDDGIISDIVSALQYVEEGYFWSCVDLK